MKRALLQKMSSFGTLKKTEHSTAIEEHEADPGMICSCHGIKTIIFRNAFGNIKHPWYQLDLTVIVVGAHGFCQRGMNTFLSFSSGDKSVWTISCDPFSFFFFLETQQAGPKCCQECHSCDKTHSNNASLHLKHTRQYEKHVQNGVQTVLIDKVSKLSMAWLSKQKRNYTEHKTRSRIDYFL